MQPATKGVAKPRRPHIVGTRRALSASDKRQEIALIVGTRRALSASDISRRLTYV